MKLKYTYTVVREEIVTKKELKEYGELMEDEPMTIEKYREYQQGFLNDEGREYLYSGANDKSLDVKIEILEYID